MVSTPGFSFSLKNEGIFLEVFLVVSVKAEHICVPAVSLLAISPREANLYFNERYALE